MDTGGARAGCARGVCGGSTEWISQGRVPGSPGARALALWGALWQDFGGAGWRSARRGAARQGGGGVGARAPRAPLTSAHLRSARLPAPAPRVAAGKFPKPGRREAPQPLPPSATGASGGGLAWSRGAAAAAAAEGNSKSRLRRRLLLSRRRLLRPLPRRGNVAGGAQGGSGEGPRPARRLPPPPPPAFLPPASLCPLCPMWPLSGMSPAAPGPQRPRCLGSPSLGCRSGVGGPDLGRAWAGRRLHRRVSAGTPATLKRSEGTHRGPGASWPPEPPPAATGDRA